jgi:hypothetical protein
MSVQTQTNIKKQKHQTNKQKKNNNQTKKKKANNKHTHTNFLKKILKKQTNKEKKTFLSWRPFFRSVALVQTFKVLI